MNDPLVAIVVPVFNGAQHLGECLESILAQTYSNWRAVVVDNCSSDSTGTIADEFARRDQRLRVVHCEQFVSKCENYNRAVAQAGDNAEYIKILEADNWITEDCIERTVRLAQRDATIGIVSSYLLCGRALAGGGLDYSDQAISGRELVRQYFLKSIYLFGTPTNLLFRAKALREESVWFRPEVSCDDVDLCLRLLRKWNFGFVHQVLSFMRLDNNGALGKISEFDYEVAHKYFLITVYGEDFFAGRELIEVRRALKSRYFKYLGRAMVMARSKAYWDFHREMLSSTGRQLRVRDILLPAARELIGLGLNPKSTLERLVNRRHRRRRQRMGQK